MCYGSDSNFKKKEKTLSGCKSYGAEIFWNIYILKKKIQKTDPNQDFIEEKMVFFTT